MTAAKLALTSLLHQPGRTAVSVIGAAAPGGTVLAMTLGLLGVWAFGWHMAWQLRRLDLDDPASCMAIFRLNRDAGLIPALFLAAAAFL